MDSGLGLPGGVVTKGRITNWAEMSHGPQLRTVRDWVSNLKVKGKGKGGPVENGSSRQQWSTVKMLAKWPAFSRWQTGTATSSSERQDLRIRLVRLDVHGVPSHRARGEACRN